MSLSYLLTDLALSGETYSLWKMKGGQLPLFFKPVSLLFIRHQVGLLLVFTFFHVLLSKYGVLGYFHLRQSMYFKLSDSHISVNTFLRLTLPLHPSIGVIL